MAAAKATFTLWRGTSPTLQFFVKDAAGNVVDVSGWAGMFTMRKTAAAADQPALQQASVIGSASAGRLDVPLTKAQTLLVASGEYEFTYERTNAGSEEVVTEGMVRVRLDILNAA
jgi:hypothetical protein